MGHKVRGRAREKQKKLEHQHHHHHHHHHDHHHDDVDSDESSKKDASTTLQSASTNNEDAFINIDEKDEQMPFFGLLTSEQSGYFKQAESTLALDAFDNSEAKTGFVQSVFEEAKGNELKLATNQICSKLMERLVMLSDEAEIKQLYLECKGFFYQMCVHKYASHVMETFLVRVAGMVEKEMVRKEDSDYSEYEEEENGEVPVKMEGIILEIVKEMEPKLKWLAKNRYGSHVLRLLLLILAGGNVPSSIETNSLLRSKKSKIARKMVELNDNEDYKRSFQVPSSFNDQLGVIIDKMIKNETTESLRETAIDPIASPALQLLIQLEGKVNRERPFFVMTFGRADQPKNDKEGSFMEYLLSDPVGSHFLQWALSNQKMKNIKRLYQFYMEDRIVKLAKRETTGAFVIQTLLEKLNEEDQKLILDQLVPILGELIINSLNLGSSIVDCSERNSGYLRDEIVSKLFGYFDKDANGRLQDNSQFLNNVLQLDRSTLFSTKDDWPTSEERRRSIFLEKLITLDNKILAACIRSLLKLSEVDKPVKREIGRTRIQEKENNENEEKEEKDEKKESNEDNSGSMLVEMCKHGVFSHVVETCLSYPERVNKVTRRRLLNALVPFTVELACDAQGSHIIDEEFEFTFDLNMFKERIASKLLGSEDIVKSTVYGRQVWKNWKMNAYARHFGDWKRMIKQEQIDKTRKKSQDDGDSSFGKRSAEDDKGFAFSGPKRARLYKNRRHY